MNRSTNHPDADYTPNDIGPPQRHPNEPLTDEERKDYYEKLDEMKLDEITW